MFFLFLCFAWLSFLILNSNPATKRRRWKVSNFWADSFISFSFDSSSNLLLFFLLFLWLVLWMSLWWYYLCVYSFFFPMKISFSSFSFLIINLFSCFSFSYTCLLFVFKSFSLSLYRYIYIFRSGCTFKDNWIHVLFLFFTLIYKLYIASICFFVSKTYNIFSLISCRQILFCS